MRAKAIILFILFANFFSCKSKCNCETDCTERITEAIVLTESDYITTKQIYSYYLKSEKERVENCKKDTKTKIDNFNSNSNYDLDQLKAQLKLCFEEDDLIGRMSLDIDITELPTGCDPCPDFPDISKCCSLLAISAILIDQDFGKVILNVESDLLTTSNGYKVLPLNKVEGFNSSTGKIPLKIESIKSDTLDFELQFK